MLFAIETAPDRQTLWSWDPDDGVIREMTPTAARLTGTIGPRPRDCAAGAPVTETVTLAGPGGVLTLDLERAEVRAWFNPTRSRTLLLQAPKLRRLQQLSRDGCQGLDTVGTLWTIDRDGPLMLRRIGQTARQGHVAQARFACPPGGRCRLLYGNHMVDLAKDSTVRTFDAIRWHGVVAVSADGRRVLRGNLRDRGFARWARPRYGVELLDASKKSSIGRFRTHYKVTAAALSADGRHFLVADGDYTAKLWHGTRVRLVDTETGEERLVMEGHPDGVGALALSDDGRRALIGGGNFRSGGYLRGTVGGRVLLVDTRRGEVLRTLSGHRDRVHTVGFSSDGRHGLSVSDDGTARIWHLESGASPRC